MGRFSDKVIIVTGIFAAKQQSLGSSNGIGRAAAVLFAKEGAKLTITGRDEKALEVTKSECLKAGAKDAYLLSIIGDITNEEIRSKLIDETVKKFGKLNVLVNNHGGAFHERDKTGKFLLDIFDKTIDLNCRSSLAMSEKAMSHLKATKGCIVNVSSIASKMEGTPAIFYATAKSALDHITRNLALENAKNGVRINAINPGLIETQFLKKMGYTDEAVDKTLKVFTEESIPIGRYGVPDDVAHMILFLSDNVTAGFITGQTFVVDGGTTLTNAWYKNPRMAEIMKH
ncbi:unnamed protein product [Enterobius vermicularis]|uniref:Oxidoreductase n=1 Tax=Enterobius vermicularis TaxID=51028 RepID=A0A0N4V922_ENTVE|nr:unnamed protein product [Enterobius vermicularis]